jgi:hypothetical protein
MALFPMSCVLRGFSACNVLHVRLGGNPCAALLNSLIFIKIDVKSRHLAGRIKKIAHFQIGNYL